MAKWMRFQRRGKATLGTLIGDQAHVHSGDVFGDPQPTGETVSVGGIEWLCPVEPRNFHALWTNSYARAEKEGLFVAEFPLYFMKATTSLLPQSGAIRRPPGFTGSVKFEAELGIVIGRDCFQVSEHDAADYVFGYTCVNDVTAPEILNAEPRFKQWTRSKSFPTFGAIGPVIETALDLNAVRIQAILEGETKQDFLLSDMIDGPETLVSRISQDVHLLPGDVIACGTSVGACNMENGQRIDVHIEGIGTLSNLFEG